MIPQLAHLSVTMIADIKRLDNLSDGRVVVLQNGSGGVVESEPSSEFRYPSLKHISDSAIVKE